MSASDEAAEEPARPAPTTMISYFRLFAGLTSLMFALWLRHLSASGPAGTLESSVAMVGRKGLTGWHGGDAGGARLEPAEEDRAGNREVAEKVQRAEKDRDFAQSA